MPDDQATNDPLQRRRIAELLLTVAGPMVILGLWEFLSRTNTIDSRFWPAPSTLWGTVGQMLRNDNLAGDIAITARRILLGFLLGTLPGIVLGLAMGLSWPIRTFFLPISTTIYVIPKIAILPLMIIAFGIGETSRLVTVALSIFFVVALNAMAGVMELDRSFTDVAHNLGATRWQLFRTVALPGSLPAIFTGMKLAMGFALVVVVGTEFVNAKDGLGYVIWNSYQTLRIRQMFVGLVLTGILGWVFSASISLLEWWFLPWKRSDRQHTPISTWLKAAQPGAFAISSTPIVAATGLAYADGTVRWDLFAPMMLAAVFTHAARNFTNEYFRTAQDPGVGQSASPRHDSLSTGELRFAVSTCFTLAFVAALPVIAEVGQEILWIAIASATTAFFYNGGPYPLANFALGEVVAFVTLGIGVVAGTYYVHAGTITVQAGTLAIAIGSLSAAVVHANNMRDIDIDRQQGKRTLANLLSPRAAAIEYGILVLAPFVGIVVLAITEHRYWPVLVTYGCFPLAVALIREVAMKYTSARSNTLLRRSIVLQAAFGLLAAAGLFASTLGGS